MSIEFKEHVVLRSGEVVELDQYKRELLTASLSHIAADIRAAWPKPYFGALPYLDAMSTLASIDEHYMYDSGHTIVIYFLSNAKNWRGPIAQAIKAELKRRLK